MPRNASGTFSLVSGNPVVSGTLIDATWANNTLNDIANEMTDSLSRSGEGGMLAPLRLTDGVQATPGLGFTNEPGSGIYRAGTNEWWSVAGGAQVQQHTANGAVTRFAAGAVGTPSLSAFGDVNTGLWFPAADTLAASVGGVEALRVNSAGVLSLVNNPTLSGGTVNGVLYLNGSKAATSGSDLTYNGNNLGLGGSIATTPSLNKGYYLQSDTNNHVIGYSLNVNDGANNRRGSMFLDDSAGLWGWDVTASSGVPSYVWRVATSEVMRLNDSGNLGIGTSSPGTRLHTNKASQTPGDVTPSGAFLVSNTSAGAGCVEIGSGSSVLGYLQVRNSGSQTYYDFALQPNGGNVGIGTSSPGHRLTVDVGAGAQNIFAAQQTGVSNGYTITSDGTNLTHSWHTAGSVTAQITANGSFAAGAQGALATTATNGFLYVPTCAGVPTGTPTVITGLVPIVVDTTNNRWYFYSGGAWRNAGP
jgi:hypothetical protein